MNGSWQLGIRIERILPFECDTMSDRIDDKLCASYCGAFQSLMYL